jgi:chaperonin GroEL
MSRGSVAGEVKNVTDAADRILRRALEAPVTAIVANSGESHAKIKELFSDKAKNSDLWRGFNAKSNQIENLKEAGIIDPLKVTKTAFINAISVASNYLTVGAAVTDIPEKKEKMPGGGMPGMGGMEDY